MDSHTNKSESNVIYKKGCLCSIWGEVTNEFSNVSEDEWFRIDSHLRALWFKNGTLQVFLCWGQIAVSIELYRIYIKKGCCQCKKCIFTFTLCVSTAWWWFVCLLIYTEFTQGMILPTANGVTKQPTSQAKVKMDKFQVGVKICWWHRMLVNITDHI